MAEARRERRRHVVYITNNTEYHCRRDECVAVRDRRSGRWRRDHQAVRGVLLGGVDPRRKLHQSPSVGTRLFIKGKVPLMTSPVVSLVRPEKTAVWHYSSQCWAGVIG